MDYNDKFLDLFSGDLSPEEREKLKKEFEQNKDLQEDLKLEQELLHAIRQGDEDTMDFRSQLKEIGNEFLAEQTPKRHIHPGYWLAAASVAVVIGLSSILGLFSQSEFSGNYTFMEYYEPYGADMRIRGEGHFNKLDKAISFYQEGNMTMAINEFERLSKENTELAGFFTALCYMELGETGKAKTELESISKSAIFYSDHIEWYLALCYLKENDNDNAKKILATIANAKNQYSGRAEEILNKMKE